MTKERFFEWLDSRIEADKERILRDDNGERFTEDLATLGRNELHVMNLPKICKTFDIPVVYTLEDDENFLFMVSFEYKGYKITGLGRKEEMPQELLSTLSNIIREEKKHD